MREDGSLKSMLHVAEGDGGQGESELEQGTVENGEKDENRLMAETHLYSTVA
jgi:hypothetical protein